MKIDKKMMNKNFVLYITGWMVSDTGTYTERNTHSIHVKGIFYDGIAFTVIAASLLKDQRS